MNTHAFFASAARNVSRAGASAILSMAVFSALFAIPKPAFAQAPTAPAVQAASVEGDGPALWVIRDEDSTLYLFGSVHVLRPTTAWETPRIKAAFDASSDVWMEISNPDDQAAIVPLIQQHGLSPQTPLSSLLTAEEFTDLDAAAQTMGATAAQLALAWVLAQGDEFVPIPGTRRIATLEENVAAVDLALTAEDLARIEAVFPKGAASGHRYAETARAALNR